MYSYVCNMYTDIHVYKEKCVVQVYFIADKYMTIFYYWQRRKNDRQMHNNNPIHIHDRSD